MKKISSALAALAMLSTSIMASSVAYAGTYTGVVTLIKGLTLTCTVTVDLYDPLHPGKAVIDISPPVSPECDDLFITSNPHKYDIVGGVLTIYDIRVETLSIGNCFGDLSGTVTDNVDGSKTLTVNSMIPAEFGPLDCYVIGELWKPAHP